MTTVSVSSSLILKYLHEMIKKLTLIRMTKDEKGLAFFKGLLL